MSIYNNSTNMVDDIFNSMLKIYGTIYYPNEKNLYAGGTTIKDVIFNNPATIVKWSDGSKTVVKCQQGDIYNPELGLAMCVVKKCCGNKGNFNDVFKKWIPKEVENNVKKAKEKCI